MSKCRLTEVALHGEEAWCMTHKQGEAICLRSRLAKLEKVVEKVRARAKALADYRFIRDQKSACADDVADEWGLFVKAQEAEGAALSALDEGECPEPGCDSHGWITNDGLLDAQYSPCPKCAAKDKEAGS